MPIDAALLHEHHLVDPDPLVSPQILTQLIGRADAAAAGIVRQLVLHFQKPLPQIGDARLVFAEQRVIAERVAEEAEPVETAPDRFRLFLVT